MPPGHSNRTNRRTDCPSVRRGGRRGATLALLAAILGGGALGARPCAADPTAEQLQDVAKIVVARTRGAAEYEVVEDRDWVLIAVKFPRSRVGEAWFPDVGLYLYDKRKQAGSADAGRALALYGDHLLRRHRTLFTDPMSLDLQQVDKLAGRCVADAEPRVEQAMLLKVGTEIGQLAALAGSGKTMGRLASALLTYGLRQGQLQWARADARVGYDDFVAAVTEEYDADAATGRDVNLVIRGTDKLIGPAKTCLKVRDLLGAAGKIEQLRGHLEFVRAMPMDGGLAASLEAELAKRKTLAVRSCALAGLSIVADETNFETIAQFLMQTWKHALTCQNCAEAAQKQLGTWKDDPQQASVDVLGPVAAQAAFACRNLEIALEIQRAVIEKNRGGLLGGLRAWVYEKALRRPGLIDRKLDALGDEITSVREAGLRFRVLQTTAMVKVRDSVDFVRPLDESLLAASGGGVDIVVNPPTRPAPPAARGMLDCVFCIDTTGSMSDDIRAVKDASREVIASFQQHCAANQISLQVGLVTYQDHSDARQFRGRPEAAWLVAWPMTSDSELIRKNILAIHITSEAVGGDPPEDLYAALMCAMDKRGDWQDRPVKMGWRAGAAKIIIVMCDAPPHEPDFEGRTLDTIAARAEELDPVHIYPLVPSTSGFLDPTVKAMDRLAEATGGEVANVDSAAELPGALVTTVKRAIQRHAEEIYRAENPPYGLFIAAGTMTALALVALCAVVIAQWRQRRLAAAGAALAPPASAQSADRLLTGQSLPPGPGAAKSKDFRERGM